MPDRYLREGLLRSDRWHALTLDARELYVRLILCVDDFGVYDGRDAVIAQAAYYMGRSDPLPMQALHEAGMIVRFTNAGKPYIAITRWGERLRGRRRFPAPPVDVDIEDCTITGKFGNPVDWANPNGCDAVSVLLGLDGRPVAPQPPEWRRVGDDWMPIGSERQKERPKRMARVRDRTMPQGPSDPDHAAGTGHPVPAVTARVDPSVHAAISSLSSVVNTSTPSLAEEALVSRSTPQGPTTTPPNGEELIDFKNGEFQGLTEAQRLRWQGMFDALAIPDEVERAAAWLQQHAGEREAIRQRGEGFGGFLIRWLLRSSNASHSPYQGKH